MGLGISTVAMAILLTAGCPKRSEYKGKTDYVVPKRSTADLRALATTQCKAAISEKQPVLLEFSASWCPDCRALAALKKKPALASALGRVKQVEINIGDFERHKDLITFFDVDRIASWVMLRPEDCSAPIFKWPQIANRVVEPMSGSGSEKDLVAWLKGETGS